MILPVSVQFSLHSIVWNHNHTVIEYWMVLTIMHNNVPDPPIAAVRFHAEVKPWPPVPTRRDNITYTRLKRGHISSLSSRCSMPVLAPVLERKKRILYHLSHFVTIRFAVRAHNVVLCFWRSLNIAYYVVLSRFLSFLPRTGILHRELKLDMWPRFSLV